LTEFAVSPQIGGGAHGSNPSARATRFQIDPARGYRLEAVSSISAFGTPRRGCWSAVGARPLYNKGQGAIRGEADAAQKDRVYTVISGVFYIGLGDQFDGDKVKAFPPGSVVVLPGNTSHLHWAKSGEYVTQVTAIGPLGLEYMDPGDES